MERNAFLAIDLEGTCCDKKTFVDGEREAIEIGAVLVSEGKIIREYSDLIKPVRHPILTPFCRSLTGITQAEVDQAERFPFVWQRFWNWGPPLAFYSWGAYDWEQLQRDCQYHGLPLMFQKHYDLSSEHKTFFRRRIGRKKAMDQLGLKSTGKNHRGLDDARDVAQILIKMVEMGWTPPVQV